MEAEWKTRVEFAEYAEALGIVSDAVMGAGTNDDGRSWTVLFTETPTADPAEWIWQAMLWRNPEGILEVVRQGRFRTVADFTAGLRKHMEKTLGERDRGE
jgi:hypothetical protein